VQPITEHIDELVGRADEHREDRDERPSALTAIYNGSRKNASKAFKHGAYHQALEFARAAEVLAHVRQHGPRKLERGKKALKLTAL